MGTGFTIDTPLKVARFGISSVISLVDDRLIEKIRRHYCEVYDEPYEAILDNETDKRARRITEYLNLLDRHVNLQTETMKREPFIPGNDLCEYFELLPDESAAKKAYIDMLRMENAGARKQCQEWLRTQVVAGAIDVNIMTKIDGHSMPSADAAEDSDAMAALRGFAKSNLSSSVVFSAGLNLHLYAYAAEFDDFIPRNGDEPRKKIILKVSDFRSALVQAKVLAKKGVRVSEYRVESGLNCGGHAFPTVGLLMGPILEEFKRRKQELTELSKPFPVRVTAQGGVGTAAEHRFLLRYYELDSVGWGSPFLLVPEATAVDEQTLKQLAQAGENDIHLSNCSPLGVPFYTLTHSSSEEARRRRIGSGKPGSACFSKHLALNNEFGTMLCPSSAPYQKKKIEELNQSGLGPIELNEAVQKVTEKACICRDLGDGALVKYDISDEKKEHTPAVCPGPNLAYFSRVGTLHQMLQHIYGKINLIHPSVSRPHVFIKELKLYIGHLRQALAKGCALPQKDLHHFHEFKENLKQGIEYYGRLAAQLNEESLQARRRFVTELSALAAELEAIVVPFEGKAAPVC